MYDWEKDTSPTKDRKANICPRSVSLLLSLLEEYSIYCTTSYDTVYTVSYRTAYTVHAI